MVFTKAVDNHLQYTHRSVTGASAQLDCGCGTVC